MVSKFWVAFLLMASVATAMPSGPKPCHFRFLLGDFKHSGLYLRRDWGDGVGGREGRPEYLAWTAKEANRVAAEFHKKDSVELLKELAETRAQLEEEISGSRLDAMAGLYYGVLRDTGKQRPFTAIGYSNVEPHPENKLNDRDVRPREMVLNPLRHELVKHALAKPLTETQQNTTGTLTSNYRDSNYVTTDGRTLSATRILHKQNTGQKGLVWFYHPEPARAQEILADVKVRLARLSKLHGQPKREELARAMHGYFQAMPFERGSAAIGAAFFPGVIAAEFGQKVALPDAVDVVAMTMDTETFVKWLLAREEMRPLHAPLTSR